MIFGENGDNVKNQKIDATFSKILVRVLEMELVLESPELIFEVLLRLDHTDILNFCRTSKKYMRFYSDPYLWSRKAGKDLAVPIDLFFMTSLPPNKRYLEFLHSVNGIRVDNRFLGWKRFINWAAKLKQENFVNYAIKRGYDNLGYPVFFGYQFAILGNKEIIYDCHQRLLRNTIKLSIPRITSLSIHMDYNTIAKGSLVGNNKDLFDYIHSFIPQLNRTPMILASIESGNTELFNYIYSLGSLVNNEPIIWEQMMIHACISGSIGMFDYIRSLIPDDVKLDQDTHGYCANFALENNYKILFDHVRSIIPTNYNENLVSSAVISGNIELVNYAISLLPDNLNIRWNDIAGTSLVEKNIEMFDYILKVASSSSFCWNTLIWDFLVENNINIFMYVLTRLPSDYELDFNLLICHVIEICDLKTIKHFINLAPVDYQWEWVDILEVAEDTVDEEIMEYLKSLPK